MEHAISNKKTVKSFEAAAERAKASGDPFKLLDIDFLKSQIKNPEALSVTLKKDPVKGSGLFATKPIKKGQVIAYYKMKVYDLAADTGPFGITYHFTVYKKNGAESNTLIGNLYEGSAPKPFRNIPFWGYFANEPSGKERSNAYVDQDLAKNYKNRERVYIGDTLVYKIIATRDIAPGKEILWNYGETYIRHGYIPNK